MASLPADLSDITVRVAGVAEESIVDGPGLRFVLFLQGCRSRCRGCQNPQTWDFSGGTDVTLREIEDRILADPLVHGVTLSGGEPFEQAAALIPLARSLRHRGYHLAAFSGFTFEQLAADPVRRELLSLLDLLVDGPYIESQRSLELRFRGSRNQRIINIPESIRCGWIPVLDPLNEAPER